MLRAGIVQDDGESVVIADSDSPTPSSTPLPEETGKALCNSENVDGYHTNDGEQHLDDMPMFGQGDFANSSRSHNQIENEDSVDHHETGKQFHSESHSFQQYSRHSQGDGPLSRDYEDRMSTRITSNDEPKPNIIVNYLPQNLTDKEFFHLFAPYGPMESIKIMRDSQTGYSFGYGFVNYIVLSDAIDARNALNGTQLGHKRIKVSFARPPSDDIKDTNLFVTGLPTTITEAELDRMFSQFGVIVHLRVLRDRQTKTTRGVAFVRYETRSEACTAILEMNGFVPPCATEAIRVRLAQDHGKQKAAYLAGYQAALKMKGPGARVSDTQFRRSETSFDLRSRNVINRGRPMTVGESIRVTTSSSDPTLYWKGFLQGAREPKPRPETAGNPDRRANSRSRNSRY